MNTTRRHSLAKPEAVSHTNSLTASAAARHARVDREVARWAAERRSEYEAAKVALERVYARGGPIPRIRG